MVMDRIKLIWNRLYPSLAGPLLFFILFLYGLANNMSISYLGNRSEAVEDFILENFLFDIILIILKVLSVYLIMGLILGLVVQLFILSYRNLFKDKLSRKKQFLFNFLIITVIVIIAFLKDIIVYPQVYMNNFYIKNSVNRFILDFMVNNTTPLFFSVLEIVFAIIIFGFIILAAIKMRSWRIYIILSNIFCIAFIVFLIGLFSDKPIRNEKANIIILASDALRPDHLSGFGYYRKTSPNIDRLIGEGISFRNAFIEVPRTFPSWVSFLTGQFASTHGIRHMFPTSRDLNRDFKTIVKLLKKDGYYTGVVADYAGDIFTRIDLGFEYIDAPFFNFNYMIEQAILEEHTFLLPFLTNRLGLMIFPVLGASPYFCPPDLLKDRVIKAIKGARSNPFFIVTFFSSTHFPYASPYPYYKLFTKEDYSGPYRYYKQKILSLDNTTQSRMSDEDIEQVRALYDGGIRAFDDAVGEIVSYLEGNNILDNTVIVILSDHHYRGW